MIRSFRGYTPRLHPSVFVSEMAYVVGNVEVGETSTVWPGAVIRGDSSLIKIGSHTHVEDNVVIHGGVEIGDYVTIGHSVVIHGIKIGSHCLLGNNCTILEGSTIGDYCVIGANALVSARMVVPDHSFVVGIPGEIRPLPENLDRRFRPRTDDQGEGHYDRLGREFREAGLGDPIPTPADSP